MRIPTWLVWLSAMRISTLGLASATSPILRPRDYEAREYYAAHLASHADPLAIAEFTGLEYEGPLGQLRDHYLFSGPLSDSDLLSTSIKAPRLSRRDGESVSDSLLFAEKQKLKKLHKRTVPCKRDAAQEVPSTEVSAPEDPYIQNVIKTLGIQDPIFNEQWHLYNQLEKGHDVNVTGLWLEGITGANATVAIVDDGLDMDSEDLKANYFAAGSYDFNDHVSAPKPQLADDRHGTRCAGEISAVKNDVCGVGVAWDSKIAGIRILSKQISDADEAIALNYAFQENQIYSCSWGPPDDGKSMDAPGILIKKAMVNGIQNGRQGLGSIYVFASGNGAANGDNCNFDGYTNSIYSITVGAIDHKGMHPYYSELCSAQMVVTYSSGSGDAIHTTDVGTNQCYSGHGGTSAAAPLAAGIFALALSVRPELTWRDLQYLALETAVPVNEDDPDWEPTAIGKMFNHKYGYGKLDAYSIVHAAMDFKPVKPQAWYHAPIVKVNHAIPQGDEGLKSEIKVDAGMLKKANLERLEHVTVTMNARHGRRGDMSVDLISPTGVISHIATYRKMDESTEGYQDWTFMSVKHWGENGVGTWSIIIRDTQKDQFNGTLIDWSLTLWGEAIDAEKAELHPMPGEEHVQEPVPTTTAAAVATTTLSPLPSEATEVTGNPSDHAHRPVNSKKPTAASTQAPKPTEVPAEGETDHEVAEGSEGDTDHEVAEGAEDDDDHKSSFLPTFLPTFGVSAKTQAWIYGAFVVIVAFIALVAVYLVRQRRKAKARQNGMDYEFEALNAEDLEEGGGQGVAGAAGGGRRKARDLYDAFGASDDEEEMFSDVEKDYDEEAEEHARGIDEGRREGDREKLLSEKQ